MNIKQFLEDMYAAYDRGEADTVRNALDEDLVFTWPTESALTRFSGSVRGRAKFEERIGTVHAEFEYLSFKPVEILVEGDRAAVRIHMKLKRHDNGRKLETHAAHFITVKNGKVVELIEYFDTALIEFKAATLPGGVALPA